MAAEQKYIIFVNTWFENGFNGREAARAAGYNGPPASLDTTASVLLSHPKVDALVREKREQLNQRSKITVAEVLDGFVKIASANMQDFRKLNADGREELDTSLLTRDQWAAVQEINTEETYEKDASGKPRKVVKTKLKLYSKDSALKSIGQFLGMFEKRGGDPDSNPASSTTYTLSIGNANILISGSKEAADNLLSAPAAIP